MAWLDIDSFSLPNKNHQAYEAQQSEMTARILVVDDTKNWREFLSDLLTKGGFIVNSANSIMDALKQVEQYSYAVIILDLRLQDQDATNSDGMVLLRHLWEAGYLTNTHVVILSAYATLSMMRQAFRDYGVADFVGKGDFESSNFMQLIGELISKQG